MKHISLIVLIVLALSACTTPQAPDQPSGDVFTFPLYLDSVDVEQKTFESQAELEAFIANYAATNTRMYRGGPDIMVMESAMDTTADGSAGAKDFSETNVQVQGIDEADIIKTDGDYIYTVTDQTLFIVDVRQPNQANIIYEQSFDYYPLGLFLYEDSLVVMGSDSQYRSWWGNQDTTTYVDVLDVTDRSQPIIDEQMEIDGYFQEGRLQGDTVFVVSYQQPSYDYPIPVYRLAGEEFTVPFDDIRYYDMPYSNPQFVSVFSFDIENVEPQVEVLTVDGNPTVYMSHNNLFVSYTKYYSEWDLTQRFFKGIIVDYLSSDDKRLIEKIENADAELLSVAEKQAKILGVYERAMEDLNRSTQENIEKTIEENVTDYMAELESNEYTFIHRIDTDSLQTDAQGSVPGTLVNQFAMDEQDGVLRLATTTQSRYVMGEWVDSANHVYALDKDLDVVGSLLGLAEDESIYSTRFVDDRLYMVTFRQIDPFFVIDLSDPANIKELGELKIPGFSRYLHPYDENTIIGIGQDATLQGRAEGLKISLFDVSDVTNPQEVAQFKTDEKYASSTALYEHKAFLFSKEKNLLVIPAYSYGSWDGEDTYNGAFVFNISKDAIVLRGLIDHGGERYGASVERSLYIENDLYTKSPHLLRINDLEDLSSVARVELSTSDGDFVIY